MTSPAPRPKRIFLLDTNVLIGFALWLPIPLNKAFWLKLSEALKEGRWVLLDAVVQEVKYNPDLVDWCKEQSKDGLVCKLSDEQRERGVEINNQYQMIDEVTLKSTVDTYLIAYAEANALTIFSRESPRKDAKELYKIPDVCRLLGIKNIRRPEEFMGEIGYKNN